MPRPLIALILVAVGVAFLGWVALPWFKDKMFGDSKEVRYTVLSAFIDNEVELRGAPKGQVFSRLIVEMEMSFPYGNAPDSLAEMTIRDDEEKNVDVNWGDREPEKYDVEGRALTKLILRETFFPPDFKQGKVFNKGKYLFTLRIPPVPYNPPSK